MRNVGIRSRGLGSRSSDKPGLELEFDYYDAGQRFLGLRSLVLDNLVTDPSMLREAVATAFLRRVGVPAPRESFARLFVNGEFVGLYAMVEAVNRDFAQAAFGGTGLLFEFRWTQPFYESYLGDELDPYATLFASRNPAPAVDRALYAPDPGPVPGRQRNARRRVRGGGPASSTSTASSGWSPPTPSWRNSTASWATTA